MTNNIDYFFFILILILPLTLITGPAIPDISITVTAIYFTILVLFTKKFPKILSNNLTYISVVFWLFLLIISLFAENKILAYQDALIFIRILAIPIFLYFWIFNNEYYIKKITTIVFFAVLFVCFDCIFQFLNYDPEIGFGNDIFGFNPSFYGRLTGPFYNELIPGAFVSKFSLIGLVFLLVYIQDNKIKNILIILYFSLVGFVCYISGERMALATFLLGLFFLIIFFRKKRIILITSLLLILALSFTINKTHPFYNDYEIIESTPYHLGLKIEKKFLCKANKNLTCKKIINLQPSFIEVLKNFNQSAYGQIYNLAFKMWIDHPFSGIGMNNFTYLCNNNLIYSNTIKNYNCTTHPHNIYLQWLVETGIFGLLLFLIYLFFLFKLIIKNNLNQYSIISLATMIILFWPIMSTGSLLKNWMGVSTFFIIGICLSLNKIKQKT